MKTILINDNDIQNITMNDFNLNQDFFDLMDDHQVLESNIVYFSAGQSQIKEILIKRDPTFSI